MLVHCNALCSIVSASFFDALLYFGSFCLSLSLPLVVACVSSCVLCVSRVAYECPPLEPDWSNTLATTVPSPFAFLPLSFPPSLSMSSTLTVTQTRASSAPSPAPVPSVAKSGPTPVHIQVDGDWYDLTHWKKQHPGGALILEQMHGNDATGQIHTHAHARACTGGRRAQLDATRMQACTPRQQHAALLTQQDFLLCIIIAQMHSTVCTRRRRLFA